MIWSEKYSKIQKDVTFSFSAYILMTLISTCKTLTHLHFAFAYVNLAFLFFGTSPFPSVLFLNFSITPP